MTFQCQFCMKNFKREATFMQHSCPQKQKHDLLQQPTGQAAYALYSMWMQEYKRKVPAIETFADSRYFKTFVDIANMMLKLQLPNIHMFVQLMAQKDISPMLWSRDECYRLYLEYVDNGVDPLAMVEASLETLMNKNVSGLESLAPTLLNISLNELIHLLQVRKMSPWLLLCSKTFKNYLMALSQDERELLMKVIIPEYWADKLQKSPEVVKEIKMIVSEVGLNT